MPRLAAVCITFALLGCMTDLDEMWLVKDLRMLGIRATPPELPQSAARLPPITVDALVVDPTAPADRTYTWELWACTVDSALCDGAQVRELLRRDRTTLDGIRHEVVLSDELRRRTIELLAPTGYSWAFVTLELRVFPDSGPVLRGVKQVLLRDVEFPEQPMDNPDLARVEVDGAPLTDPIQIDRCKNLTVAVWGGGDSQGVAWLDVYVSRGRVTSWETAGSNETAPDFTVSWNPCDEEGSAPGDTAYLWLVARNGIGGIDWVQVRVLIGGASG